MDRITISYRVEKVCKHSVRMTPNLVIQGETYPDVYVTNTILEKLGLESSKGVGGDLLLDITFAKAEKE